MGTSIATPCHGSFGGGIWHPHDTPSDAKVSFFDNLLKNLTAAQVLRKNIWFSIPIPKIKFNPPPQEKMLWCSYFRSLIQSANFSRCRNFIEKLNFVSTPWKIIIPLENSEGDHISVINPSGWVMIFLFMPKCYFLTICEKNWHWLELLEKILSFHCLSLKLGLTLPHKGKMFWCSYFKFFIKLTNFSRCRNFIKKLNFVSTPWKVIIPLGNSVRDHINGSYKSIWVCNDFFMPKCHFLTIWWKNLTAAGVLRKNVWFLYLSLKLSLTLPNKGKCFSVHILGPSLSKNLDRCGNLIKKFNVVSTPSKIIIP